ncbi:hypothetical protein WJS89_09140 [Sphingomicrobium sp. XHP0235]|uniref:hypothetical protein n=1 Tax=Sphingomicrobium aquimarinum TaxID=3133971 RepID=UPI0031FF09D7
MNSSAVYFLGFLILIGGLAYAAIVAGVPSLYVGIGAVILLGIGLMSTVTNTKSREPAAGEGEVKRTTTTVTERD